MNYNSNRYPSNQFYSFLRSRSGTRDKNNLKIIFQKDAQNEKKTFKEAFILCRACKHKITTHQEIISVNGSQQHTFANPNGIIFDIKCYKTAPGCLITGPFTQEFSWFKGYLWRISICASCLTHLGWLFFSSNNDHFYGLIQDRLIDAVE
jgi:filamentous hemagglutinin family protein